MNRIKEILRRVLIGAFWIGVWWAIAKVVGLPKLLPGPGETALAFARLCGTEAFWRSVGMTLLRVALGYGCAVVGGVLLAVACHQVKGAEMLLSPLRTVIRATPVSSFILLVWLWLKRGHVSVFISFLMVLPIIWTATQEALGAVDGDLREMARMYRFSRWKKIRYLYAPSVRPAFLAACMTGLGFAWKSGIAAEVIALTPDSVGKHLSDAKNYLEYPDLFAWTLTVILLSMALEACLKALARKRKGEGK
ncbi:MAG: ABC transporter permease subunit [Clostridia bacterium]|nr:ABC transporter permease subunit [Clostridia bacterium]